MIYSCVCVAVCYFAVVVLIVSMVSSCVCVAVCYFLAVVVAAVVVVVRCGLFCCVDASPFQGLATAEIPVRPQQRWEKRAPRPPRPSV